jgi:hypothetical protein
MMKRMKTRTMMGTRRTRRAEPMATEAMIMSIFAVGAQPADRAIVLIQTDTLYCEAGE